jgi:hypothetical protein
MFDDYRQPATFLATHPHNKRRIGFTSSAVDRHARHATWKMIRLEEQNQISPNPGRSDHISCKSFSMRKRRLTNFCLNIISNSSRTTSRLLELLSVRGLSRCAIGRCADTPKSARIVLLNESKYISLARRVRPESLGRIQHEPIRELVHSSLHRIATIH